MYFARTAQKLREQMVRFSGELSAGLPKVSRRFVAEMVFGIQARGSVRLTEVGRSLGERITLKKTEERLSRQLGRRGLDRENMTRIWQQALPEPAFSGAKKLIQAAIGKDWEELTRRIPELR